MKRRIANQDRTVTIDVPPEERLPIRGRIDVGQTCRWIAADARIHRIRAASMPQVPRFSGAGSGYRGCGQNERGGQNRLDAFHESRSPDYGIVPEHSVCRQLQFVR